MYLCPCEKKDSKSNFQCRKWLFVFQVDEFSNHIVGGGHWGHCKKNCLTDLPRKNNDEVEDIPEESCTILGNPGICQPASTCPLLVFDDNDDDDSVEQQCSVASHICCKEFLQNDPQIVDRLAASALQNVESFEKPDDVSLETGKFFFLHWNEEKKVDLQNFFHK